MSKVQEEIELVYKARGKDAMDFLKAYNSQMGKTNSTLMDISKQADSFSKNTKYMSAGLSLAGLASFKLAANLERQQRVFGVVLKDIEKGKELFNQLNEFSARTPLQIQDLTKQAQKLIAAGILPKDIINKLQMLGDIALGDAEKLNTLTRAFARVQNKGKATMEEINMVSEAGVGILAELAKNMGVTTQELFKLVERGKVSSTEFARAFETMTSATGIFHNGMEELATDTMGKASTAFDNVKLSAAELGNVVLPIVNDLLDGTTEAAKEFRSWDDSTKTLIVTLGALGAAASPAAKGISMVSKSIGWLSAHPTIAIAGITAAGIGALIAGLKKLENEATKPLMGHTERTELLAKEYINLRDKTKLNADEQDRLKTLYSELKILSRDLTDETLKQAQSYEDIAEAVKKNQIIDKKKKEYQELEQEMQRHLKFTRDAQEEIKTLFSKDIDDSPKGPKKSQRELLSSDAGNNFWDDTEEGAIRVEERMQRIKEVLLSLKDDKGSNILGLELASELATESEEKILDFLSKFSEAQDFTKSKLKELQKELIELQNPTDKGKANGDADNSSSQSWLKYREEMDKARAKEFEAIEKQQDLMNRLGIEYDGAAEKQKFIKKQMEDLISLTKDDVDYPFQPDGPTLTLYKQIYDEIEKSKESLTAYSEIDKTVNEELGKMLNLKEKLASTETLIIAARESGDELRLGALQKIKKEYEDTYETIVNNNSELSITEKIEKEISDRLKEKTEDNEALFELNLLINQAQKEGDIERLDALQEIKSELGHIANEELNLTELAKDFKNQMANMGGDAFVNTFENLGEALANGDSALSAISDTLDDLAQASLNTIKTLALEAGLKAICAGQWQIGLALLALAGVAAFASGVMGGSGSMDSGGLTAVQQLILDAERDLAKQRVKILKEQMRLESEARDDNMKKLDRYFNDELAVLQRALENNRISQETYTEKKNALNTFYDEQENLITKPYDDKEVEYNQEVARIEEAERLQEIMNAVIQDKIDSGGYLFDDNSMDYLKQDNFGAFFTYKEELEKLQKELQSIYDLDELNKIIEEYGLEMPVIPEAEIDIEPVTPVEWTPPTGDDRPVAITINMNAPVYGVDDLEKQITTITKRNIKRGNTW